MADMQSVSFPSEVPVEHESEVLVVGGGPGGIGAAVAAARAKIYIDSTGDGDLAAMAGCSFEYGG